MLCGIHGLSLLIGLQNTEDPKEVYGIMKPYDRKSLDPESLLEGQLSGRAA